MVSQAAVGYFDHSLNVPLFRGPKPKEYAGAENTGQCSAGSWPTDGVLVRNYPGASIPMPHVPRSQQRHGNGTATPGGSQSWICLEMMHLTVCHLV